MKYPALDSSSFPEYIRKFISFSLLLSLLLLIYWIEHIQIVLLPSIAILSRTHWRDGELVSLETRLLALSLGSLGSGRESLLEEFFVLLLEEFPYSREIMR